MLRDGRQRRETIWAPITFASNTIGGTTAVLAYTATAAEDALRPYTVVRTHLYLGAHSDQQAASEVWNFAIGACIVSDQASAIGVTAVPTPVTDLDSDAWYMHRWLTGGFEFSSAVGAQELLESRIFVDSKAMRKVEDGFDNVVTIEAAGGQGVVISTGGRQLLKLH